MKDTLKGKFNESVKEMENKVMNRVDELKRKYIPNPEDLAGYLVNKLKDEIRGATGIKKINPENVYEFDVTKVSAGSLLSDFANDVDKAFNI